MALDNKEQEIIEYGKQNGKTAMEIRTAIAKYRGDKLAQQPVEPPKEEGFLAGVLRTVRDIPNDLKQGFNNAKDAVTEGMNTANEARDQVTRGEITPGQGTAKTIGGGLLAGAKVVGEGFMSLLKLPFSQETEDKISAGAQKFGQEFAERVQADFEELKNSDDPTDRKIANDIEMMIKGYQTDPGVKAEIDAIGGIAAAAAELFGLGKGSKVVKEGFESAAGSIRRLEPEFDVPYFRQSEAAINSAIEKTKSFSLNRNKVEAPVSDAAPEAVAEFKQELINNVNVNVKNDVNLDEVVARLDTLIEQGQYERAVQVADNATTDPIPVALTQKVLDTAVTTGQKAAQMYRTAVEGSTARISRNLDNTALKENAPLPIEKIDQNLADMYVNAVSPGVKGKKTSLAEINKNKMAAVDSVKLITKNKSDLQFRDIETNQLVTGELPSNLWEFGGAISHQKAAVYKQIFEKIKATADDATGAGDPNDILSPAGAINTTRIQEAMQEIVDDPVYKGIPQVQSRAKEVLDLYGTQEYTIDQIERLIQIENDRLQAFYRGSGSQADAVVSAIVANNLRDILDEAVESATGEGVKALKSQYGNLKAIERDVVHRALHSSQAREAGLVDMFGIRTIGDIAAGASGDIGALKRGAAQIAGEGFIKALNDRDALVNRMFLVTDDALAAGKY